MNAQDAVPLEIEKIGKNGIRIRWRDGHEAVYPHSYLRENCQCAACVDEWSGKKLISPDLIPEDISPIEIKAVGRYAISIHWSDDHNTGIYPFDYMRSICPCADCEKSKV